LFPNALDFDASAVFRNDSVRVAQAKAGASAHLLGREERSQNGAHRNDNEHMMIRRCERVFILGYPLISPGSSGIWAPCQSATIHTVSSRTR
jgi:hypothetical protein